MNHRSNIIRYTEIICSCILVLLAARGAGAQEYSTCKTWKEVAEGKNIRYAPVIRVSNPGTPDKPSYTGFWFFDVLQFDPAGNYALAMKVDFQGREVKASDRGEIGVIDLKNGNKWQHIGETTAWNWQQGCRLQWRPGSDEILWNDRADDGSHFVCRAYNFKTGARRTLPRPVYHVSPDGRFALTHDFQRMKHGGTAYVGIKDPHAGELAPESEGIEKMDLESGRVQFLISLKHMAEIAFPQGYTGASELYFFREGWNPSGTRFIAFLKNSAKSALTQAWSISVDGRDVRYFYNEPSHHTWQDDATIIEGKDFQIYKDDGSGKAKEKIAEVKSNFDPTILPAPYTDWILGDTYAIGGYQHLFLFHRPSRLFVPLARLKSTAPTGGTFRVDLHARTSRDGRVVCIDATHEGLGRQMYIVPIGPVLDHPPVATTAP